MEGADRIESSIELILSFGSGGTITRTVQKSYVPHEFTTHPTKQNEINVRTRADSGGAATTGLWGYADGMSGGRRRGKTYRDR